MSESIELKPCPFCGGEASIEETERRCDTVFSVGCDELECIGYQSLTCYDRKRDAAIAWNTRAESPDGGRGWISIDDRKPEGEPVDFFNPNWIDTDFNPHGIREGYRNLGETGELEFISAEFVPEQDCWTESTERPTHWRPRCLPNLSPPPPVAADGELIDKLGKWISGLPKDKPYPGKEMADAIVLITESYIALQSRSTPPPVAGGELQRIIDSADFLKDSEYWDKLPLLAQTVICDLYDIAALQHQDCVNDIVNKYQALLYAVETKHPGESRFETALRYIQMAEEGACDNTPKQSLERKNGQ